MSFQIRKVYDKGTADPFVARLFVGILELRDKALQAKSKSNQIGPARQRFDKSYTPIWEALVALCTAMENVQQQIMDHQRKISEGKIIRFQTNALEISETIDKRLRDEIASFLVNGVIAMKRTQRVVGQFDIDIGCLFKKQTNFEKGICELKRQGHVSLAEFLYKVRSVWSESFINRRNSLEHEGWCLPQVQYNVISEARVEVIEPQIDGIPVSRYVKEMFNRIASFVENVIVHAFKTALLLRYPIIIAEIPPAQRNPSCPERFCLFAKGLGGSIQYSEWDIQYSESDFS